MDEWTLQVPALSNVAKAWVDGSLQEALFPTDSSGHILFENLRPGRFLARVDAPGFASASVVVELDEGAHAGRQVRTRVRPVELFAGASLVEAEPLTGRTHQIRVHLLSTGHPLLVDHQYGRAEPLKSPAGQPLLARTPLHAARLEWPALPGVEARALESPLPEDMERTVAFLRQAPSA